MTIHSFFERSTLKVAKDLLGKFLVKHERDKDMAYMIVEVEAYDGFQDRASHAHKGETERNRIMFGEAGYWYVYLVYGMYNMLNIVTGKRNHPAAILIRGTRLVPTSKARQVEEIDGPGKLTRFLKIDRKLNGGSATQKSGLWFEDRGVKINKKQIKRTPRIGVHYAGEEWSKKPYRFVLVKK